MVVNMEEKGPRSGCSFVVYKPQRMYILKRYKPQNPELETES